MCKTVLSAGFGQLRSATFELGLPNHLPPSCALHAADGRAAVDLKWQLLVTFERFQGSVPWAVPLRVVRRPNATAKSGARAGMQRDVGMWMGARRLAAPGLMCATNGVEMSVG